MRKVNGEANAMPKGAFAIVLGACMVANPALAGDYLKTSCPMQTLGGFAIFEINFEAKSAAYSYRGVVERGRYNILDGGGVKMEFSHFNLTLDANGRGRESTVTGPGADYHCDPWVQATQSEIDKPPK
jgi:hypothetical protein